MIQLVYNNQFPNELFPYGIPESHQLQSTTGDNLIELAGRVCYDSLGEKKTRDSVKYHQHINEVNHGSVQEHFNFCVEFRTTKTEYLLEMLTSFLRAPGIYVSKIDYKELKFRVVCNLRSVKEFGKFNYVGFFHNEIRDHLEHIAFFLCPLAMPKPKNPHMFPSLSIQSFVVQPTEPEEIWLSFYIQTNRGCTHELVRHKYRTAVSQRSTRYVDESLSPYSLHPLITENLPEQYGKGVIAECQNLYRDTVTQLEQSLTAKGVDAFTAKKQARGAARDFLGNGLQTELIFSASLAQWIRILEQRLSPHADAKIRVLAADIYEHIMQNPSLSIHMPKHEIVPCQDGIKYGIIFSE